MFIGHYSAALALKSVEPKASLGLLFLAVQFVDILFFPFVYFGIERFNLIENFTASTHFELEFMPYTHGLAGSLGWAVLAYIVIKLIPNAKEINKNRVALVMAAAVLSHWFLDVPMHTPDLPLLGDDSLKLGFGLWNNVIATLSLETVLLLAALWLYFRSTKAVLNSGKYVMILFAIVMIAANVYYLYGPPPGSKNEVIISALFAYFLFAAIAFWLDKKRIPV